MVESALTALSASVQLFKRCLRKIHRSKPA